MTTILIRTVIVYFILILSMRLMGKRQIGELQLSELITALLLSEIATVPITDTDIPISHAVIPVITLVAMEISIAFAVTKSPRFKRVFDGMPSFLIIHGKLQQKELAGIRMSLEELIAELRLKGIADISDVDYAILEQNGKLSVLSKADATPPAARDMQITPPARGIAHPIIIDGNLIEPNLQRLGLNISWLEKQLNCQKLKQEQIYLFTIDDTGDTYIVKKEGLK